LINRVEIWITLIQAHIITIIPKMACVNWWPSDDQPQSNSIKANKNDNIVNKVTNTMIDRWNYLYIYKNHSVFRLNLKDGWL
jgi:hypothetical protein